MRKPLLGREGQGISLVENGLVAEGAPLADGAGGSVWQGLASMATGGGKTAVFGSWLIDGEAAGMGVRESRGRITGNLSQFVPHLFR